jgi:hypothetical protein
MLSAGAPQVPGREGLVRSSQPTGAKAGLQAMRGPIDAQAAQPLPTTPEDRQQLIARLRDSKGGENTQALAKVIEELDGESQQRARQAMVDRMCRMTARTLQANLAADVHPEVRLASIQAIGRVGKSELIGDLIPLLKEREPVYQAAHDALVRLTNEDFGPTPADSGAVARIVAAGRWQRWWEEQESRSGDRRTAGQE